MATRADGSQSTTGISREAVCRDRIIPWLLESHGIRRTSKQVKDKIRNLESTWRKARDLLRQTGQGLDSQDDREGVDTVQDKVLKQCRWYYVLEPHFGERAANSPPFVDETSESINIDHLVNRAAPSDDPEETPTCPENTTPTSQEIDAEDAQEEHVPATGDEQRRSSTTSARSAKRARTGGFDVQEFLASMAQRREKEAAEKAEYRKLLLENRAKLSEDKVRIAEANRNARLHVAELELQHSIVEKESAATRLRILALELELERRRDRNEFEN